MITDTDITKLKKVFITKEDAKKFATKSDLKKYSTKDDLKEAVADLRAEIGEVRDITETTAAAVARIENTLDGIAGAIRDQWVENGAGAAHLERHDRQISALAFATNVTLPD